MKLEVILGFIASIGFFVKIPIHIYLLKANTDKEYNWEGFPPAGPDKYLFFLPVIIPVQKEHYRLKLFANILYWNFVLFLVIAIIFF